MLLSDHFENDQLDKLKEVNIKGYSAEEIFKTNKAVLKTIY